MGHPEQAADQGRDPAGDGATGGAWSTRRRPHVVVVGVCASGKSTLKEGLTRLGYSVESVAQEHTLVKGLWRRARPDVLIVLNCSLATIQARRANPAWPRERFEQQRMRLADAREQADILIDTDHLTPPQLVGQAVQTLREFGVEPTSPAGALE